MTIHRERLGDVPAASPRDWQDVLELLDAALDLDHATLPEWLALLPPERPHLVPLLTHLFQTRAVLAADGFLRSPPAFAFLDAPTRFELAAGARVGPYRLLREIGRGGMADVWLADRADGLLDRQIALKLPHLSWGSASYADRMARERNILASLTHPNIARLYDAGIAEDGRPFLALEYVDGEPIDTYAAAHGLALRARIELVVQVARAVAHAHTQRVVHRDLKPSNILVDGAGGTHLLDFGIAKLVDSALDPASSGALTQAQGRAMTPDYASPEQIRGDPIGPASDIYSLGVVLFELLTGTRPHRHPGGLGPVALAAAIERAAEPRASARASGASVRRQLAGDLDAILGRGLAKASDQRYATMDAFADDLERHLRGEPVRARVASPWYRSERWVRRHKLEVAVALAVLAALLGGAYARVLVVLALGAGATLALWQRNQALRQAERARVALARAEQVTGFIASIFTHAVPRRGEGGVVSAADLLREASLRIETDLADQPEVAAELAALVGTSFNELGELRAGLDWLPRAVERCTRALGPTHRLALQSRWRLVEAANGLGEIAVSEPLLPALVRDLRQARPAEPVLFVAALRSQAFVHTKRAREPEAMAALHEAVEVATAQLGESSEAALASRAALSNTCTHFGRGAEALQASAPALALARAAFGAQRPHPTLVAIERCHADALARSQRPRDAVALLRQVVADQRALDAEETPRVRVVMTTLAYALQLGGHFDEAETLLAQAESLHERLTGAVNDEGVRLAGGRSFLAALRGDGAAALAHVTRAVERAAPGHDPALYAVEHSCLRVLAQATAGEFASALAAAEAMQERLPTFPIRDRVRLLRAHVMALRQAGRHARAGEAAERALLATGETGCSGLEQGLVRAEAARCSLALGDAAQAERRFREALAAWRAGQVDAPALQAALQREIAALSLMH
jgi:serine/threonine protein kinase